MKHSGVLPTYIDGRSMFRQRYSESQPAIGAVCDSNISSMQQNGIFNDRQSQTGSSRRTRSPFVYAVETFEQAGEMFVADTVSIVCYKQSDFVICLICNTDDDFRTAGLCYSIINQVVEYRKQQRLVAKNR